MEGPRRPRLLNPAVMRTIVEKCTFRKPWPESRSGEGGTALLEELKQKYQAMVSWLPQLGMHVFYAKFS